MLILISLIVNGGIVHNLVVHPHAHCNLISGLMATTTLEEIVHKRMISFCVKGFTNPANPSLQAPTCYWQLHIPRNINLIVRKQNV